MTLYFRTLVIICLFSTIGFAQNERPDIYTFTSSTLLEFDELMSLGDSFKAIESETYLGATSQYIYVKVDLNSFDAERYLIVNNPLFDTIICYKAFNSELLESIVSGQAVPFNSRLFHYQDYIYDLEGDLSNDVTDVYFVIKSTKPINFPIEFVSYTQLVKTLYSNDIIFGVFFGIIAVMFFYNLIVFFVARDSSYLYYVMYLFAIGLTQTSLFGYTDRFLLGEWWPWLNNNMTFISGSIVGMTSLLFIKNFLHLKTNSPKFDRVFTVLIFIDLLALVLSLVSFRSLSYNIISTVALVGSLMALYISLRLIFRGYKSAKFFFIAWSIFFVSVIIFVLKDYDVIAFNPFTRRIILVGSVIEVVLLSIALADRINDLRKEKEESQAKTLEALLENEKIVREQNVILEERVQERTMELQESNEELESTLVNLKETQSQLVDAEKMASLGQLTAGIAHEINNPINFVTSNISPLKRDLSEVYEIIEAYDAVTAENAENELEKARGLQEELDFEYLKEEIENLVEGISDGALRTQEIVKGLRTFSRLDEDDVKLASVDEGVDSTLVILQSKTKDIIEIEKDYETEIPLIECYPGKLNQVFMNILNNSVYAVVNKAYEEGEEAKITVKTKSVKEGVQIYLIDNGIGMNENTQKKLFEPFFTTKDVGEGTGLGMSIVFKIIEKHNGKIEINSELGKGSEFIITLPLRQPKDSE